MPNVKDKGTGQELFRQVISGEGEKHMSQVIGGKKEDSDSQIGEKEKDMASQVAGAKEEEGMVAAKLLVTGIDPPPPPMTLAVQTICGDTEIFEIFPNASVQSLKGLIAAKLGVPPHDQVLFSGEGDGEPLKESKTLQSYGLDIEGSLVFLVRKGREFLRASKAGAILAEDPCVCSFSGFGSALIGSVLVKLTIELQAIGKGVGLLLFIKLHTYSEFCVRLFLFEL
jgi:hypothetical protein